MLYLIFLLQAFIKDYYKNKSTTHLCGFKLTLDQIHAFPLILDIIIKNKYQVIYRSHLDKLKLILSLISARHSGRYHSRVSLEKIGKYSFDPNEVISCLNQLKKWGHCILTRLSDKNSLVIYHEHLFNHYSKTLNSIIKYLGIDSSYPLQVSDLKKSNSDELSDWVNNLNVLKDLVFTHAQKPYENKLHVTIL